MFLFSHEVVLVKLIIFKNIIFLDKREIPCNNCTSFLIETKTKQYVMCYVKKSIFKLCMKFFVN